MLKPSLTSDINVTMIRTIPDDKTLKTRHMIATEPRVVYSFSFEEPELHNPLHMVKTTKEYYSFEDALWWRKNIETAITKYNKNYKNLSWITKSTKEIHYVKTVEELIDKVRE